MSSFTPVTAFSGAEIGDVDKLNEIVANQNILYALTPTFLYSRPGQFIDFDEGQAAVYKPAIYVGRVTARATGATYITDTVPFPPDLFATSCKPVVNVSVTYRRADMRVYIAISNYSTVYNRIIDKAGFRYRIYEEGVKPITQDISVHFSAFGYQEA